MEGTYLDTANIRLKTADTIIFLDTPLLVNLLAPWNWLNLGESTSVAAI